MIDPITLYRISNWFYKRRVRYIPAILTRLNYFLTNCDLPASIVMGRGVQFRHYGCGCIVHHNSEIGDNVWFNPHVVLGQDTQLKDGILQNPSGPVPLIKVGCGVMFGAGAKVIAKSQLIIGDNASIGANAVVLASVPENGCVVGIPGRVINR